MTRPVASGHGLHFSRPQKNAVKRDDNSLFLTGLLRGQLAKCSMNGSTFTSHKDTPLPVLPLAWPPVPPATRGMSSVASPCSLPPGRPRACPCPCQLPPSPARLPLLPFRLLVCLPRGWGGTSRLQETPIPISTHLPQGLRTCDPLPEPRPPLSPLRPLLGQDLVSEDVLSTSRHTAATPRPLQHLPRVPFL